MYDCAEMWINPDDHEAMEERFELIQEYLCQLNSLDSTII